MEAVVSFSFTTDVCEVLYAVSGAAAPDCSCKTLKVSGFGKAIRSTTGFGTYTKTYDSRQGKYYWKNGVKAISRVDTRQGSYWYIGPIHDRFTMSVSVEKNEKHSL